VGRADFDQTLALRPENIQALYLRGVALSKLNRYEEAIAAYDQTLALQPKALKAKGFSLIQLNQFATAGEQFTQAVSLEPDDANAWYNWACCLAQQEHIELALEKLAQALNKEPERFRAIAQTDPDLEPLRTDLRFQKLLEA
jgi:tetratricopeptide (TPR) repeat protein